MAHLVINIYASPKTAAAALRRVERANYHRAALLKKSPEGKTTVDEPELLLRAGTILFVTALLAAALVFELSSAALVLLGIAGGALFLLGARHAGLGIARGTLRSFERLVLDDEAMLLVEVAPRRLDRLLELLRLDETELSARFVLRDTRRDARDTAGAAERGEPFAAERLRLHAARLATSHRLTAKPAGGLDVLKRIRAVERTLEAVRRDLDDATELELAITPAAEWILDNAYIIEGHVTDVERNLPAEYREILPTLESDGAGPGYRVYVLARELVLHTDGRLDRMRIVDFLKAYQETAPLRMAELWVFPLMLRFALIEDLARRGTLVNRRQQERERADFWANRLLHSARKSPDQLLLVLAELARQETKLPPHFAIRITGHLHDEESALAPVQSWLERKIKLQLHEIIRQEHARQAADQVSIANAVGSLRRLGQIDWREIFETTSLVDEILRGDPARIYPLCDFETRNRCREAVEKIARHSGTGEIEIARGAIEQARRAEAAVPSVWHHLDGAGRPALEARFDCEVPLGERCLRHLLRNATPIYLGGIAVLTAVMLLTSLVVAQWSGASTVVVMLLGCAALFPASELAIQVVNLLMTSLVPPRRLPRLSFESGIPDECRTLVVVPMMLLTRDSVRNEIDKLEVRYLANTEANLRFALLADYADADRAHMPEDAELLAVAEHGIERLNARHPDARFLLFHRERRWSETEHVWIGWERKRGKVEELTRYLNGEKRADSGDLLRVGDPAALEAVRFVITLDSDTQLPHGAARRMIETMAHPANRPKIAADGRTVESGYTIIQPRVTAAPDPAATWFSRLFADAPGCDPYHAAVSDAYQDLFGEAIYLGKAIYDVAAFHEVLSGRFPEETLLSHDLIEGTYVRVGYDSTIELVERFPSNYIVFSKRQHRWIRGDWQIADWLLPTVPSARGPEPNPLSVISRWKILDNLRRSLLPAASIALLAGGWFLLPDATLWNLLIAAVVLWPGLAQLPRRVARGLRGFHIPWREQSLDLLRSAVALALLPHKAWVALDAIGRVWHRRLVSHRRLLEWETAQAVHWRAHNEVTDFLLQMMVVCLLAAGLVLALIARGFRDWPGAVPFLLVWFLSPAILDWISRVQRAASDRQLAPEDSLFLREIARRTWRFYDDLIGPETHWLPPDNIQEALRLEVAERTSPTNIGMALLAGLAAQDFGYITLPQLVARTGAAFDTLGQLELYEGHLLNWYDTRTLEPLRPRYVSTVDSGNLLASLWVLEQGCLELRREPLFGYAAFDGLLDTLRIVRRTPPRGDLRDGDARAAMEGLIDLVASPPADLGQQIGLLRRVAGASRHLSELLGPSRGPVGPSPFSRDEDERLYWVRQLERQTGAWVELVERYLACAEKLAAIPEGELRLLGADAVEARARALERAPSLEALARGEAPLQEILVSNGFAALPETLVARLDGILTAVERARDEAAALLGRLDDIIQRIRALDRQIRLRFLYDAERELFSIGYNVDERRRDGSYYDLLASEARVSSFVAIARGEVPVDHWWSLGRPYGSVEGRPVLMSWGGTMFEYLMALLFQRGYESSLLDQACKEAVALQIRHGRRLGVPWGISESAFSALDGNRIYQYRAFGVPGLGLKRELDEDLVVSPYSTALALSVDPIAAVANLRRLARAGLLGSRGFYEAIDYSRSRRHGEEGVPIYAYMAHHQGMTLLALDNVLNGWIVQRRFHADLRVRAAEPLLLERIPETPSVYLSPSPDHRPARLISPPVSAAAVRLLNEATAIPRAHLLSNGSYSLAVTNSGGGFARWRETDLTRWRSDTTRDAWGSFCYVRDLDDGSAWSTTYHPLGAAGGRYSVNFASDRVEFRRRVAQIETLTQVVVSPEDDVEIRRVTVTNRSPRQRRLDLTSYMELALAPHASDRSHVAFSKMFIQTEALPERGALLAWRRSRELEEPAFWAGHLVVPAPVPGGACEFETDRARFLGRGRDPQNPAALRGPLSNRTGSVLDPIFSLRCPVVLEPHRRTRLTFVTLAAETREGALRLIEKYRDPQVINRVIELAWTHARLEFRYLGIEADDAQRFQELASHMLYPNALLRPPQERLRRNFLGQSRLWGYGISGDLPILTVTVSDSNDLGFVREVLLAHTYWRLRGLKTDLVILNKESGGYEQALHNQIQKIVQAHSIHTGVDRPGGVFLREVETMPGEDLTLLLSVSRATLVAARGSLAQQLNLPPEPVPPPPPLCFDTQVEEEPSPPLPFLELDYFNGIGGFTHDGREYAIYLDRAAETPAPWSNVLANPRFGALVTESGQGFEWHLNSQSNRLSPWVNDPVTGGSTRALYLRDEESGVVWSPTALPVRERDPYRARHGQGYSVFEHSSHAIEQELLTFVPVDEQGGAPVRIDRLRLRNRSSRRRRLSVTAYTELVLGTDREETQPHVITSWDPESRALLARNPYHPDFGGQVAFAALSPAASSYNADRTLFLGRNGSAARPAALDRKHLPGRAGPGLDPCAALQVAIELDPGQETQVLFLLGEGSGVERARSILEHYRNPFYVQEALDATREWWDRLLGTIQVETPDAGINLLLNRWLLYQTLGCRIWGRSALYQSGGAFGFRDQLQDMMALLYSAPELVRDHIVVAAGRQFVEGDVQHWWHPPHGGGVRTRCSDDLLWLPYVTAHYVRVTGDASILDARVPFLDGRLLEEHEHEIYFVPTPSVETGTVYEHCRRAIEKGSTLGPHGLPLIGSGDWNDGLNRVGSEGKGESVWLAWFLIEVLDAFGELAAGRGDDALASFCGQRMADLVRSLETAAWDGEWYLRGYFDDGTPLGSGRSAEAQIDSLPQSWAVIAGGGDRDRAASAMRSVEERLVRASDRLVLLFAPPFDRSRPHPGYIMGYPPGVRENGGQYTHAALWVAMATARQRLGARAVEILRMLNPIEHTRTPEGVARYRGEPYVVAADVYALPGEVGRSGWTWYTGSSGWMYRVWLEEVLGFRLRGDRLTIDPTLPPDWPRCAIRYRYRSANYEIAVENPDGAEYGVAWVELDGERLAGRTIPLADDGQRHTVRVRMRQEEGLEDPGLGIQESEKTEEGEAYRAD